MNILLLGPQGSGKGTQARLIRGKFNFYLFEAGEFLRELSHQNEYLRKILSRGDLVPDKEMASYVSAFLESKGLYDGILFDGFPRTLAQYKVFKSWLEDKKVRLDLVFVINISEEETIKRLSARRMNPGDGRTYNLITDPPPPEIDRKALVQREDDQPASIKKRLKWYKDQVVPLINLLKKETKVVEVDGERPIEVIFEEIAAHIQNVD